MTKVKSKELVTGPGRKNFEEAKVSYLRSSYECAFRILQWSNPKDN